MIKIFLAASSSSMLHPTIHPQSTSLLNHTMQTLFMWSCGVTVYKLRTSSISDGLRMRWPKSISRVVGISLNMQPRRGSVRCLPLAAFLYSTTDVQPVRARHIISSKSSATPVVCLEPPHRSKHGYMHMHQAQLCLPCMHVKLCHY